MLVFRVDVIQNALAARKIGLLYGNVYHGQGVVRVRKVEEAGFLAPAALRYADGADAHNSVNAHGALPRL